MSQIPGVNVTDNRPKSMLQSKTVWAVVAAAVVKIAGELVPSLKEALTEDVINALVTVLVAAAAIFGRKSVEDTKTTAVTGVIKK